MPGTIIFKPLEANLVQGNELKDKFNTFCQFTLGDQKVQSQICEKGGKYPHWNDCITLTVIDQPTCKVEVKAEGVPALGSFEVNLDEIESKGCIKKWYHLENKDLFGGEVLMEAIYTSDPNVTKSHPIMIGTKPKRNFDDPFADIPVHIKIDLDEVRHEKASQGNIPGAIDPDRIIQERSRWAMEPINSTAKIAETNEFGDYQPHKQLPFGDLHNYGSGRMEQGSYYSGQQTSYGEAYPMVHKSVATDQLHNMSPAEWISDRTNPFDYARYQQQAFLPHHNIQEEEQQNLSVVEKAIIAAKKEKLRKESLYLFNGYHNTLSTYETQYSDQNPSVTPENEPEKTNAYVKDKENQNNEMMSITGKNLLEKDQMRPSTASTAMTNPSINEI